MKVEVAFDGYGDPLPGSDNLVFGNVVFGIFGLCLTGVEGSADECWKAPGVGYDIVLMTSGFGYWTPDGGYYTPGSVSGGVERALHILTGFLILYPIAAGIALVACLTALAASRIGCVLSVVFAFVASVITLLALIVTFVLFTIFEHLSIHATFINATWIAVAACLFLFVGTICVFCGWLAERRARLQTFIPPLQQIPYQTFVYPAQGTPNQNSVYPAQESLRSPSLPHETPTNAKSHRIY